MVTVHATVGLLTRRLLGSSMAPGWVTTALPLFTKRAPQWCHLFPQSLCRHHQIVVKLQIRRT